MKPLLFLFLLTAFQLATAQNYLPFNPNKASFYLYPGEIAGDKNVATVYFDSAYQSGTDYIFKSAHQLPGKNTLYQLGIRGMVWHFSVMSIDPAGIVKLFDSLPGKTEVIINTPAGVGDKWVFWQISASNFIEAEVTGKIVKQFLNFTDTVKMIKLTCFDNSGNKLSHFLNNTILELSYEHGLLSFYSLNEAYVSKKLIRYELTDFHPVTNEDIYNFEAGDEFVRLRICENGKIQFSTCEKVLSKTVGQYSTTYEISRRVYEYIYSFPGTKLIENTIYDLETFEDPVMTGFPELGYVYKGELVGAGYLQVEPSAGPRRIESKGFRIIKIGSYCWLDEQSGSNVIYVEGQGCIKRPQNFSQNWQCPDGNGIEQMYCFYKVNGAPGSTKCFSWGVGVEETKPVVSQISVFPNPANDELILNFPAANAESSVDIYDVNGKFIKNQILKSGIETHSLYIEDIQPGIYLITLRSAGVSWTGRFVKLP